MKKLFILEDEALSILVLESTLSQYDISVAQSVKQAKEILSSQEFDVYLLDFHLPDGNSMELVSAGMIDMNKLVYFISSTPDLNTKIMGLELGAEDFISKPFHPMMLKARLDNKIAKAAGIGVNCLNIGDLTVDDRLKQVFIAGDKVQDLTKTEYQILKYLVVNKNRVLSRQQILQEVLGINGNTMERTVDAHVSKLRKKLGMLGSSTIKSVHGFGYKVDDDSFLSVKSA